MGYRGTGRGCRALGFVIRIWVLVLLAWCGGRVRGENVAAAFDAANKLYYEGKFAEAAAAYEKLAQSGQGAPALYFNLGNAFFKSGQIGRAIAAYRQAEQLAPRDPDVRANLQFARDQIQGPTLSANRRERWLGKLTLNEWTLSAAGSVWLCLLLMGALQWRPAWKKALRSCVLAVATAAVSLCACVAAACHESHSVRTAVVITHDAVVRSGPLELPQNIVFTLHDGAELRVLGEKTFPGAKEKWLEVSAGPLRSGWLRADQVLTAPPG